MAKEICISSTPHETRLAILEDDQLAEIYYERENEYTLAGSVYNGRVTRVLPGMQSAFVDIGLERDAFLYVTDFLELEDQEESDEVERAATAGAAQPPREVHHEHVERAPEREGQREGRGRGRDRRRTAALAEPALPIEEQAQPAVELIAKPVIEPVSDESGQEAVPEENANGGRRWRGRRRRRGGRGGTGSQKEPVESTERTAPAASAGTIVIEDGFTEEEAAPTPELEVAPQIHAEAQPHRRPSAPEPFVLPGESLSRYGGSAAEDEPKAERSAPARRHSTAKPSTMIDTPIAWDGASPLLPGESIARHRADEPEQDETPAAKTVAPAGEIVEDEFEETEQSDAEASYKIDSDAPSGFRLFGFGGKKKDEEEHEESKPAAPKSNYAPGNGPVEEEIIEEAEYEAPRRSRGKAKVKAKAQVQDDFEEETLPTRMHSGDLGEMLQEAHLDHRIDIDLDGKNGAEEEGVDFDEEGEEEEPAAVEGQPKEHRERGGRGRRGRGDRGGRGQRGPSRRSMQTSDLPIITDLLKPGQEILVQIAKEPIAKKGARITSHIALPGRFLVFMPTVSHVGVSRKIASDDERQRLKRILVSERGDAQGGFIVRTAAEGASEEELRADLRFLLHMWSDIKQRSESSKSPALIYHDLSLIERILRDQVSSDFSAIWVDSQEIYERTVRFLNHFSPTLVRRVKLFTKETPLFEHFGIQDEISKALRSKVWLKSGGSIVINQTEALVAIDINTGKYVGKSARLEDTIVKTNLDSVPEIVRQIRLRDLGGIIVIDFIDMDERKNRFKVLAALEEALKADRAPTKVLQFNDFGLVAITRKRVKQSLERTLSVPCPTCQATGMVKSPTTVCNEIWVELRKMRKHFESADILLRVHPETVKVLKLNSAAWLSDFEELTGKNILVKSDATLHPEQFDIQG
jgi:ribonuclease G